MAEGGLSVFLCVYGCVAKLGDGFPLLVICGAADLFTLSNRRCPRQEIMANTRLSKRSPNAMCTLSIEIYLPSV